MMVKSMSLVAFSEFSDIPPAAPAVQLLLQLAADGNPCSWPVTAVDFKGWLEVGGCCCCLLAAAFCCLPLLHSLPVVDLASHGLRTNQLQNAAGRCQGFYPARLSCQYYL